MARPNAYSGRLTIACAQCFFTAPLRRSSGQRRS
jgi:hypothetical protein